MKKLLPLLVVLALLGGGGYWYYITYMKVDDKPTILKAQITRGDIVYQVKSTGTLQALRTVTIGSQVSGVVQSLFGVDFNSIVKKDQVIAQLDPTILQGNVDQAQISLDKATVDLDRQKIQQEQNILEQKRQQDLHEKKLATDQALEQANLTVKTQENSIASAVKGIKQLEFQLATAKTNLGYATITSPIDGVVIQRNADQGSTINATMTSPALFLLATDLTHMKLEAGVDETDVGKLQPGQDVSFTVESYGPQAFHGTVTSVRLNSTTVQNVVTYQTEIDVLNPDLKLRPGMTATLQVEIDRATNVLRVPASATRFHPTNDMYAALGQTPPTQNTGRGGGRGQNAQAGGADASAPAAPAGTAAPQMAQANPADANAAPGAPGQGGGRGNRQPGQGGGQSGQNSPGGTGARGGFGANQTFGSGRGGGGNAGPRMTAEQQAKYNSLPAGDERTKYLASLGITTPPGGGRGGGGRGGSGRGAAANATQGPVTLAADRGATVIDELFVHPPVLDQPGTVYILGGTDLKPELKAVRVRTGISDGQFGELKNGDLKEGDFVVTGIVLPAKAGQAKTAQPASSSNPFSGPQQPQRGGGGGGGRGGL